MMRCLGLFFLCLHLASEVWAKGTGEAFYVDPFDQAAGGTVLTRATQEGMLAANPALLPYGGKFLRWLGFKTNVIAGKDSVLLAQDIAQGKGTTSQQESNPQDFVDKLFKNPIHFGFGQSASFFTSKFGGATYLSIEPDFRAWEAGDPIAGSGVPNVVARNEMFAGGYMSVAERAFSWLSFGLTAKYVTKSQVEARINMTGADSAELAQKEFAQFGDVRLVESGTGFDFGSLLFYKTKYCDLRWGTTLVNYGGMALSRAGSSSLEREAINSGLGLTFHNDTDALHLSAELFDVLEAGSDPFYKRLRLGARLLIRTYVGLSMGLYHGTPTMGAEIDLILLRIGMTAYTREYARGPNMDSRRIFILSIASGLTF